MGTMPAELVTMMASGSYVSSLSVSKFGLSHALPSANSEPNNAHQSTPGLNTRRVNLGFYAVPESQQKWTPSAAELARGNEVALTSRTSHVGGARKLNSFGGEK
ncbi:hypothetical protein [Nocardioides terrisoli]|uniref:hypothetical protein n=1 Tax=Nocardioides terrisoli TaxID=3388267 RepID=UPI00287B961D|nr:hypothetical protein [Nocardioides marmorisolisilvae]